MLLMSQATASTKRHREYRHVRQQVRRQCLSVCVTALVVLFVVLGTQQTLFTAPASTTKTLLLPQQQQQQHKQRVKRETQQQQRSGVVEFALTTTTTEAPEEVEPRCLEIAAQLNESAKSGSLYPNINIFTHEQRYHGAITLHLCGLCYMFVALMVVCDEFFVPALGVITEKLQISEDVAGATFMAAGGSAPEFFTSVIGVFISSDNVGIGTIVGSATFNILFVLAFCVLFSKGVLHLTWWPLFRDITFYIVALAVLVTSFTDEMVRWYNALLLFIIYLAYCLFMKYNEILQAFVKQRILRTVDVAVLPSGAAGADTNHNNNSHMQMSEHNQHHHHNNNNTMSVSANNNPNEVGRSLDSQLSNAAAIQTAEDAHQHRPARRSSVPTILHNGAMYRASIVALMVSPLVHAEHHPEENGAVGMSVSTEKIASNGAVASSPHKLQEEHRTETVDKLTTTEDQPLSISWPATWRQRFLYLLLAPIMIPLYFTLPDVRKPGSHRWYPLSFVGSILWIAVFSYFMVWWASIVGDTYNIPIEIMGLTLLAAGTSIPDLITSVLVARKGFGDMAVSSSVGSNLFDVCVGLPIPWLCYFAFHAILGAPKPFIPVTSKGLVCSVGMLFTMLIVLVFTIAVSKWRMHKVFGFVMIAAYGLFCIVAVLLEMDRLPCPGNKSCVFYLDSVSS